MDTERANAGKGPAGRRIDVIAFDADDTLWHSENLYAAAQAQFGELMAPYADESTALGALHEIEIRNLQPYGFGVKAFVLSMIEAAIQLSKGQVGSETVAALLATGKDMLAAEVELLDGVEEAVAALAAEYPLMVITKGDLGHQASKLERSGLAEHFRYVEIVADKNREVYVNLFAKHGIDPHAGPDGRQFAQVRRHPGAGAGRLGRLRPLPDPVGARARGAAAGARGPLPRNRAARRAPRGDAPDRRRIARPSPWRYSRSELTGLAPVSSLRVSAISFAAG